MTPFSIPWRFGSIPNIGIENQVESSRIDFKIVEIDLGFKSISNVKIVESNQFQMLKSKLDSTINLIESTKIFVKVQ